MILNWFIGVPQVASPTGTTVNFTDFGLAPEGTTTPPATTVVQRRTSVESGTRVGSRQSL